MVEVEEVPADTPVTKPKMEKSAANVWSGGGEGGGADREIGAGKCAGAPCDTTTRHRRRAGRSACRGRRRRPTQARVPGPPNCRSRTPRTRWRPLGEFVNDFLRELNVGESAVLTLALSKLEIVADGLSFFSLI